MSVAAHAVACHHVQYSAAPLPVEVWETHTTGLLLSAEGVTSGLAAEGVIALKTTYKCFLVASNSVMFPVREHYEANSKEVCLS